MMLWLPDYLHTVLFGNSTQNSLQECVYVSIDAPAVSGWKTDRVSPSTGLQK